MGRRTSVLSRYFSICHCILFFDLAGSGRDQNLAKRFLFIYQNPLSLSALSFFCQGLVFFDPATWVAEGSDVSERAVAFGAGGISG